jgi:hypothetical protein
MPTAAKRQRSIARKCSAGGAKLRLKGLSKRARSEGGSELVRCRASRPVAGGLYKGKKPAPKRKSVKNGVSHTYGETVADFRRGTRVELRPSMDRWMFGDKYGDVTQISRKSGRVRVNLDRSGDSIWFFPSQLRIEEY